MSDERWRPVVGYEGYYEVSDQGTVRGVERTVNGSDGRRVRVPSRVLNQHIRDGYPGVRLTRDAQGKTVNVHRLVALTFLGPQPTGHEVCHNDGDRANPAATNLRWGTRFENVADMKAHGTYVNPNALKTSCKRGHELAGENLRIDPRTGARFCRACCRLRWRAARDRRAA